MRTRSLVRSVLGAALLALGLLSLLPPQAAAQAVSGTILGVVKDSTGAIVPGATVTLLNGEPASAGRSSRTAWASTSPR